MEFKLDVLISTSIKQRKPWPRISWIGQKKEAVFLLDDKHINEINLTSGKTRKKIPRLQSLLKNVVVLTTSRNGAWLAGILKTGELFLWNKDRDSLKIVPAIEESRKVVAAAQECLMRLYLYVSGDGRRALLTTPTACVFLWESTECENTSYKNSSGRWTQILPDKSVILPSTEEKEIGLHADFIQNEILSDCCLCCFVFYSGEFLVLTFLILRWHENSFKYVSSLPYQIHWVQQTCALANLVPQCVPVKSRGALLCAFARNGLLLAVAVNQTDPKATQVLFLNTLSFVTVSGNLKGCSSKSSMVPSKLIRSYWVGDMSWTLDSLFLACMLKRGSLILLTCMGELLTLVTSGCSVEFGPAEFIPFHPLITCSKIPSSYKYSVIQSPHPAKIQKLEVPIGTVVQQHSSCQDSSQSLASSASESDIMRQRFSVASHSRLPYLIVSDGYMITVLRFPDNLSPSGFVRSLLLDSAQRLENTCQNLLNSKSKGRSLCLQSLLSLKASLLKHAQNQSSILPTIPKFLEKDSAEISEETMDYLVYEEESDDEKEFCTSPSSFYSQRICSFVGKADKGHLEFASMFDTIHAKDSTEERDKLSVELYSIQKNLLVAWHIGISKNKEVEDTFLDCTVNCIIHFFNILQFAKPPLLNQDASSNEPVKNSHWMHCVLKYFQQCLTVSCWHSRASLTRHVAKLTLQTLKLMLIQQQDQLFSKNLLACFRLLKMVSHTLSSMCVLQYEHFFATPNGDNLVELDSLTVPVFQALDESTTQQFSSLKSLLREPPQAVNHDAKTEKRLVVLWQLLYKKVVWYQMQLHRKVNKNAEESVVSSLLSHIQATIQSSGVALEQRLKINSVSGEEKFLLGSYRESVDIWKRSLCEIKAKGGKRTCFLQSRYYLAILFCHLYQYNLLEAQGLCDHLVAEILRRSQLSARQMEKFSDTEYFQHELWMVTDVHTETAMAVIRSMARFMAAYFTNQLLYIFPPHSVDILHPLHIKQDLPPRIIPLQHCLVTRAVRDQNLSSVWTADYALDLFLIGGLIPEAVWLTQRLGNWKLSVCIGVAYQLYCQNLDELSRLKNTEHHLPLSLSPMQTFQEKWKSLLGQPVNSETSGCIKHKQFTDPIEEEDANVLYSSIQELLRAAVMADIDILSETFQLLMDSAKDLSRKFYGLVPDGLYLPAPPLYCPQPASLSEEDCNDILFKLERESRQKVSGVLQRIILLFRAACCSCPAAQWYIAQLKWARKVMQKIRMKGSLHSLSPFPETLLHYTSFCTVFCGSASSGGHQFDDTTCKMLGWFRELCALCWMLHVRDKLSNSCRQYQTARENHKDLKNNEHDASTVEQCLKAVEWACRMLPFCRFMNIEELVQDVILSLLGELPPVKQVAEIFVKAFPNPEDVRVQLRDKYHGLQQRLRHSSVKGPESEEIMSVVIQATEKERMKALKRVIRNIGPIEINIWEPSEEGAADAEEHCYDKFSVGTSLSISTLTDLGNPQACSDADTADTLSDALLTEETRAQTPLLQRYSGHQRQGETGSENTTSKMKVLNRKTNPKDKAYGKDMPHQCSLPIVGAWEFERDDDEYVIFLELFLSYILERDLIEYNDLGIPLLTSFSEVLRDHELNSLFFDVHTTLKRRQGKTRSKNVFRAGSCYAVTPVPCDLGTASVCKENQQVLENSTVVQSIVQTTESFPHNLMRGLNEGLFGLKHKSIYRAQNDNHGATVAPARQAFPNHTYSSLQTQATSQYIYRTVDMVDIVPGEELSIELMGKLSNIAKLLEWMIRWSDKRQLCGSSELDSEEILPMIHMKTSAAAVLTSLWLLEQLNRDGSQVNSIKCKSPDSKYMKEFAPLSEAQHRTEKESSMAEGSSTLASPPLDVQSVKSCDDLHEAGLGMSTMSKCVDQKNLNCGNYSVPHMTGDPNEVGVFVQKELDKIPEIEEFFEEPYETPKSSNSSVKIKPVEDQRKKQVSISDVDTPQEDQKAEKTKEGKAEHNIMTEAVSSTISHSLSLEQDAKVPSNAETSLSDGQPSQTIVSTKATVASSTSICAKNQGLKEEVPTEEEQNTSETVKEMLQDEMWKLVQLQQINFMSLMQIVQSSFANLPSAQQILEQHQSIQLDGRQPAHPTEGTGSLKTQLPTQAVEGKPNQISSDVQARNSLRDESSNGHIKNHMDVNVSLSLLESQSKETGFMPLSEDLHSSILAKPVHLLALSSDTQKTPKLIPIEKKLNYSCGFPLLKLKSGCHVKPAFLHPIEMSSARPPLVPRVAWSSSDALWNHQSSYTPRKNKSNEDLNMSRGDPEIPRQMGVEEKRWAETVHKGPPKHLNLDQYEGQQQFSVDVNMGKPLMTQNPAGIPLLHLKFDPVPRLLPVTRQQLSATVKSASKETDSRETLQHTGMSLLHANLPRKKKAPKLIPLQDLIAFEQSHQNHAVPSTSSGQDQTDPIQLLKTDVEPFELKDVQSNRKREKRRVKKQMEEKEEKKKPSVSFCPDHTVISTSGTVATVESAAVDQQGKSTSCLPGSFFLSVGKYTMEEGITTSADLHYMASTGKKAAETQDASTNTHSMLKVYRDVGTTAGNEVSDIQGNESVVPVPVSESSSAPETLHSDTHLNMRIPTEVKDSPLPSVLSDVPDLSQHEYLSVTDIEGSDILNLPMITESAEETGTAQQNEEIEIPHTAKLHQIAVSVTDTVPPRVFLKKEDHLKNLSGQVQKEDKPHSARDGVTWNIIHEDDRAVPSLGLPSVLTGKECFSAKQQEMDMQLLKLQNLSENMEEDFRNTRLLVKKIEDFEMAACSDLGACSSFPEDAGSMGDESEHFLRGMIFEDDERKLLNLEYPLPGHTASEVHSPASAASASNVTSGIKSSSGFHVSGDLCNSSLEDPLQITGLNSVADIISDLVVEGDMSPSKLGLTKIQAEKISRIHNSAAGRSRRTEKEKKEIQAWMKRKQKERMREYVKKVEEQRKKEHNPFSFRKNTHCSLTSKDIKLLQKKKEEKDKVLLSENHNIRISQALSLMNEMLFIKPVALPANEHKPLSRTRSPREYRKRNVTPTKGAHLNSPVQSERSKTAAKPCLGQKVHPFLPARGLTQSRAAECRVSRTSRQKPPHVATAVQTQDVDQESDRDLVSPWTLPDDIHRILQDTHDSLFQASVLHPVSFSPPGIIDTDGVSEGTGSILSKLDWNAVEAMVADVEDI